MVQLSSHRILSDCRTTITKASQQAVLATFGLLHPSQETHHVHFQPTRQLGHQAEAGTGSTRDPFPEGMSSGHSGFAWRIMRDLRLL